jgi:hypothetical protein
VLSEAPSIRFRAAVLADILAFAVFAALPQFQKIESSVVASTLELDGFGAFVAASHPLLVTLTLILRLVFVGLLFCGKTSGRYVLIASMVLSCVAAAVGGLAILTNWDLLALTVLYFLDGYLLSRSKPSANSFS